MELFHRGQRVAAHERRHAGSRHATIPEHMPSAHRRHAEWSPERFRRWAAGTGPATEGLILAFLARRPHPEQGFRTCLGIMRQFRSLSPERVEAVAAHALHIGAFNGPSIASIIATGAEQARTTPESIGPHANLRGPGYFH